MKFVDEVVIYVQAGKGGDGCLAFHREKFVPLGGPSGGNGGNGANVYLVADPHMNTLVDFRYKRKFHAENGKPGEGSQCTGKSGDDLLIPVPLGTVIYDADTEELIADLVQVGQQILVANGGHRGLGNAHFKSSTNRSPRRITKGTVGEQRNLRLELKLLADVGLLGMPNAGKSTLIRAVSDATPKVADYPFTTLHPHLGVVRVDARASFVMADIPGLVEGASAGVGLGIQFLKHLARTSILLHVIDIAPFDESDPVLAAKQLIQEMANFSDELVKKERWLVLNKIDLVDEAEVTARCQAIVQELQWTGPVYRIAAIKKTGTAELCYDLMARITAKRQ